MIFGLLIIMCTCWKVESILFYNDNQLNWVMIRKVDANLEIKLIVKKEHNSIELTFKFNEI